MKLRDKVAVITGGSKGIGLGCARVFARHGSKVVLAARGVEDGEAAAERLTGEGHEVVFVQTDVTQEKDFQRLIDSTVSRFGRLDCVVNNAGWHPPEMTIDRTSVEDFERLLRLNLTSTFIGCKLAVPHLRETRGTIIIMSSVAALKGQEAAVSYVTTKAGQLGLTRALAIDLAPDRIRVNAVCPGSVRTPLMEEWVGSLGEDPEKLLQMLDRKHPTGSMGTIDEIGEVCAFLASDESSFITGQAICADGGLRIG